jgi:amidase
MLRNLDKLSAKLVRLTAMSDPLARLDATAQAELVRKGEISPVELVDAGIARIESLDPKLNAVILPSFDEARAQARSGRIGDGPFRGVPFLLKDLGAHLDGDPLHAGLRLLRQLDWREPGDTHLAVKLRAAGFIFLGRTNTPELGLVPTTEPVSYGPTRNPWDTTRSSGGSSGGSAAAVASGMVPAAHASDGGGSIRIPAAECGLVGLKPSRGRNSFGPDLGERWGGLSAEHVVSRSVRDTAAILDATAGWMPGDPYTAPPPARPFASEIGVSPGRLRIGLMSRPAGGGAIHSDCVAAADDAAALLRSLGHDVEASHPEGVGGAEMGRGIVTIIACSTARALDAWSRKTGRAIGADDVEPLTWAVAEMGRAVKAADYIATLATMQTQARRIAAWWEDGFDLLLTPTIGEPPPELGQFGSTPDNPFAGWVRAAPFSSFTSTFNATGQPAISLPLFWNRQGLPIGVQLVAAYGREDLLLRVAARLEEARPWRDRRPPVHA